MISNCGQDENGQYHGGEAGDQTGREWQIKEWTPAGWSLLLRHPEPEVREELARLAERSAENDLVGYDQSERLSFWRQLKKAYYDPSAIRARCETDCSAGTAALVKAAGFRLGRHLLRRVDKNMNTWSEEEELTAAGFLALREPFYFDSEDHLLRGDILLMEEGHHTVINLSDGCCCREESRCLAGKKAEAASAPALARIRLRRLIWRAKRHFTH